MEWTLRFGKEKKKKRKRFLTDLHTYFSRHIGFPVVSRYIWGMYGHYLALFQRILLSLVWFSVQSWTGGLCVQNILASMFPSYQHMGNHFPASANMNTKQVSHFSSILPKKTHLSVAAGLHTERYTVHWLGGLQRTHGTHLVREARKDAMGRRGDEHGDSSDSDLHVHLDHGNRGRGRTTTQPTRNSSE